MISVFDFLHVFLSRFQWARRGGHKGRGGKGAGAARAARLRLRVDEESRRRSRKRRPLLFPLSCSFPIPSSFPQRRRAAAGPIPSAHGGRGGGAGGGGSVLRVGGGGEEAADWGGWPHKESWARASATGNGHRDQPRMHTGLARCPRAQRGNGTRFLGWVAAAAAVPFVVPTRPPSHGSIAAPIPRSPASGDARRRGFGRLTCRRRGRWEAARGGARGRGTGPVAALDPLGATAHRRRGCTPEHVRGAGGPAAIDLRVCALRRGGRLQSQRRRRRWRRPLAESLWLPSPGRTSLPTRAVAAHGALSLCNPAAASPPTPPFGSRRVRCQGRPPAQATPSLPI